MKETSAVFGALAGVDLFGESDILWYDSHYKGDSAGVKDLLYKQSILSGDRVPLILTDDPVELWRDSDKTAWIGSFVADDSICGNNKEGVCNMKDHNSVCWVPRVDFTPPVPQDKSIPPGKYPGRYAHQLKARKLTMLLLHALDASLDQYVKGISTHGFPLSDSFWHIGAQYTKIREAVRTNIHKDSACDKMMGVLNATCHLEMHGKSEWLPRIIPYKNSLRAAVPHDFELKDYYTDEAYSQTDLMPTQWAIPEDQVDPHLIAISTSAPPPSSERTEGGDSYDDDVDPLFLTDDDYTLELLEHAQETSSEDNGTRRLRQVDELVERFYDPRKAGIFAKIHSEGLNLRRRMADVKPSLSHGQGWGMHGLVPGYCDGTAQSHCNRNSVSTCLMAGHNDFKAGVIGDALSGWLSFDISKLEEGLIFLRADFSLPPGSNPFTDGWTEVNTPKKQPPSKDEDDGDQKNTPGTRRRLEDLPGDFSFDFSINDKVTTLSRSQFMKLGIHIEDKLTLYPLMTDGKPLDATTLGIRIRSQSGRGVTMLVTHLYYA